MVLSVFPIHLSVCQIHDISMLALHMARFVQRFSSPLELFKCDDLFFPCIVTVSLHSLLTENGRTYVFTKLWLTHGSTCTYKPCIIVTCSLRLQLFWVITTQQFTTISAFKLVGSKETDGKLVSSFSTKQFNN